MSAGEGAGNAELETAPRFFVANGKEFRISRRRKRRHGGGVKGVNMGDAGMVDGLARWLPFASLAVAVAQGFFCWFMWSMRREFMPRADCERRMRAVESARLELAAQVKNLPTQSEWAQMLVKQGEMLATMTSVGQQLGDLRQTVHRLEQRIDGLMTDRG